MNIKTMQLILSVFLAFSTIKAQTPILKGELPKVQHTSKSSGTVTSVPTPNGIGYWGGPVLVTPANVRFIWYGNWNENTAVPLLTNLVQHLPGSGLWNILTTYYELNGTEQIDLMNAINYSGSYNDNYSLGYTLTDDNLVTIASQAVATGSLPDDPNGIYVVMASPDVNVIPLATACGFHQPFTRIVNGNTVNRYMAWVGFDPVGCSLGGPNNNPGADGMASVLTHELAESISDPTFLGWKNNVGDEMADLCIWNMGTAQTNKSGNPYNQTIGSYSYYIQQLWVNASGGSCAQSYKTVAYELGDGSFESPTISGSNFVYRPSNTSWSFTGSSGISANNSSLTSKVPVAPDGKQVGFIQNQGTIAQKFNFTSSGSLVLTFYSATNGTAETFNVLVDGSVVGTFKPTTTYLKYSTNPITITHGNHTVTFASVNSYGANYSVFVDLVNSNLP